MATTDYSQGHQLTGACPQCGAAPAGTETHCRFCQTALYQAAPPTAPAPPPLPNPMTPPPMMNQPMAGQHVYYPTVAVASSRGWTAYWVFIAIATIVVPLVIVAVVMFGVRSSVDSISTTTFTTPTFTPPTFDTPTIPPPSVPEIPKTPQIPQVPGNGADPSTPPTSAAPTGPPAVTATNVEGNGQTKSIDCAAGQNYVIAGNAMNVTASGGVCGTIIVKGNGTTVKIDGAKETWVTGNSDTVSVTKAGKLTTTGNANHVTYSGGLDGAEPTIQKGGNLSTITKAG